METSTKIMIGVGVLAAAGIGYYLYTKPSTATTTALPPPATKPVQNAGVLGTGPQPHVGTPGGTMQHPAFDATQFSMVSQSVMQRQATMPPGGAPLPAPMPTLTPTTGTSGGPLSAQQMNIIQGRSANGTGGVFTWGSGASYDASSTTINNDSAGPVAITTPNGPLTLTNNKMGYDITKAEVVFYA